MANYVNTYVTVIFDNEEAGKAKLQELYSRLDGWDEEGKYDWNLHDIFGVPETDELNEHGNATGPGTYSWNIEHMGSKWAYVEDADEDSFRITSAWSVPTDAIDYIMEELGKVDPDVRAHITAEDEMPNWVWAGVANSEGIYDYTEWESNEIFDLCAEIYPEIKEGYDEENEEFFEDEKGYEASERYYEVMWEEISDMQMAAIEDMQ